MDDELKDLPKSKLLRRISDTAKAATTDPENEDDYVCMLWADLQKLARMRDEENEYEPL